MVKLQPILENWVLDVADGVLNIYMTHTVTLILLRTVYLLFFYFSFHSFLCQQHITHKISSCRHAYHFLRDFNLHLRTTAAIFEAILLVL